MKKKVILASVLVFTLLFGTALGAIGATNIEQIKAALNKNITFKIDGKAWTPKDTNGNTIYPITYNNTNYLPIRAIGEAVGLEIGWDGSTNTIILDNKSSDNNSSSNTTTATSTIGLLRSNPAPIGTSVKFDFENFLDKYTAEIMINEVIRGEAAWKLIQEANMFNDPAPTGYEYILADINFKVISNSKIYAVDISYVDFTLVSSEGRDYYHTQSVNLEPSFGGKLNEGESALGWAVFIVRTDDKTPLLLFGRNYDGTKGAWFKVQ